MSALIEYNMKLFERFVVEISAKVGSQFFKFGEASPHLKKSTSIYPAHTTGEDFYSFISICVIATDMTITFYKFDGLNFPGCYIVEGKNMAF